MKRIILHWTAGAGVPCLLDKSCYHFLFDLEGTVYKGLYPPSANENCKDGNYAAHTGGGNESSIGLALCGMNGFTNKKKPFKFPITRKQVEASMFFAGGLCKKYGIKPEQNGVMTHYEYGINHPETTSRGKIDIIYLPPFADLTPLEIGPFIRQKVKWYMGKI
jgi:hypothetical protein